MSRWADTAVGFWTFEGHRVRYLRSGESGPPLLLVHGFGGNADHWRQSVAALARDGFRVYAIDLLGYGASDKPAPDPTNPNTLYNFERWATQLLAFTTEIVTEPVTLVSNSVGGIASLEAAIMQPDLVHSIQLMDISLRMLHTDRQPVWQRPLTTAFQKLLREGPAGRWFFSQVAKPETVKNILRQAYGDPQRVTDELVDVILTPGLAPGATEVFLDFISYSSGPLPEAQLARCTKPVAMFWGTADPWEKVEWGRDLAAKAPKGRVACFVELPGVGHCPMDEAPELVNPLVAEWARKLLPNAER